MLKEIKKATDVITNADLFNEIVSKVKESGNWPEDLIDYASPSYKTNEEGICNYEFDPVFVLKAGGNEGYYLELAIQGHYSLIERQGTLHLGTIKTLSEDEYSVRRMAALYGECLIAYEQIVDDNLDSFTRLGSNLYFLNKEGDRLQFGLCGFKDREAAIEKYRKLHLVDPDKYAKAIVRNNLTREECQLPRPTA